MRWLASNGAFRPGGIRIPQDELAREVQIPRRSLVRLIQNLETAGVLHVRRTTVDGAFGSPRGSNIYRIVVGETDWMEHIERERARRFIASRQRRSVAQRAARAPAGTRRPAAARSSTLPYDPPQDEIEALAATYSHDDLAGW
jgi:DNA-binding Lrp family transcriptional regulator